MFLVQAMAWFSLWEADLLRRGVWKKKKYVIEQLKKEFRERWASYHNYKPETTTQIYEKMIEPAASYSFNKSHSVCYAMIAYQTAYLKVHYPEYYYINLLNNNIGGESKTKEYIEEANVAAKTELIITCPWKVVSDAPFSDIQQDITNARLRIKIFDTRRN